MGAPDETDPIDDFPAVADSFDVVQWLRPKGGPRSVVEEYHALRGIPVRPVGQGQRLGEFLLTEEDPEVVAFGHDEHTFYMASTSILSLDPELEPWRTLDVTAGEMRHVARNTKVGWEEFDWWVRGILRRRLSYGLDESDTGIQVGDPPEFEEPFWTWVANAEPIPDEDGRLPDREGLWAEVSDVLMAMVITSLLNLDPHDMNTWDWKVDTYQVPPL
ncbi:hypothetical protein [uncultured Serinicoccus sp.]|uniref:hypothetical protein n=1 Tax=uncultured Serinicoccus sp. TaxID=735514 RepID=UPI0026232189|nr:hypothetical protein [uncultured Serinicoccus sp.]